MSISRTDARVYIARIIGGANDPKVIDLAEESLIRGFSDWQTAKNWEGTLKDASLGFSVSPLTATGASAVVNATAGNLDAVNIGNTVTISSGTATLAPNTTVLSYTRNTDGTIATITLSNPFGGTTNAAATLTFSGDIPIIAGTSDYNVPSDFWKPYTARMTGSASTWALEFIRPRYWHRRVLNTTVQGLVEAYTVFNAYSPNTQHFGTKRLRVYRVPSQSNTLQLAYYRKLNALSDPLDMEDVHTYKFLDLCRSILLATKRAIDAPTEYIKEANVGLENAMTDDEEISEDEDKRIISQMEMGDSQRPLWSNGEFNPDYGY
jgi:hypothetical protein